MNTKAVRDSRAFYFEPRASEGEKTSEELLETVQKTLEENFVTIHGDGVEKQRWKNSMGMRKDYFSSILLA